MRRKDRERISNKKRHYRFIKRLAHLYLVKKGTRLGSIKKILNMMEIAEEVIIKIILDKKREFRFLSNIYIGILKDLEGKYYLYYRCPYNNKIIKKNELKLEKDFFTLYINKKL